MPPSIEDRFGINDLFVRYTTALDAGDVDTIVSCFTDDGALESPVVGKYSGHSGIRTFSERFAAMHQRGVQLRHVISNMAMTVDGDTAHATCYLTCIITMNGKSELMPPGRYECELRKVDDAWLFLNRLVIMDAPYTLPGI
ncbi:MAG: nuclear transport factor 2 family protein [Acetobacteraceae bacterium]|jgi:uncharacterized protein (TIGR02246 family)